jgi:hypothetical protein
VRDLRRAGLSDLSADQILQLREREIDLDFVRRLREANRGPVSFDQMIALSEQDD